MRPVLAFLVVGAVSSVAVQGAPPQFNSTDVEQTVTVEGCLSGIRLKPENDSPNTSLVFGALGIKELRLEGTKALLKDHDGHNDEFTGVVYVPRDKDVKVKGQQVTERTRITTTQTGGDPDPRRNGTGRVADRQTVSEIEQKLEARKWLKMKVLSVRHVSDKCSATSSNSGLFNAR